MRACSTPLQRRLLLCALILSATFAFSLASSQAAHAWVNDYCTGVGVTNLTWCTDGSWHTYDTNRAWYNGGGQIFLCGKLETRSGGSALTHCGYNNTYGAINNCCGALKALIWNGSDAPHTLYGRAEAF